VGKNIKTGLKEIGREGMEWNHLPQDMDQWQILLKIAMDIRVP
jgi:hypothetical protein